MGKRVKDMSRGGTQRSVEITARQRRYFLFIVQLLSQPAAHGCDECSSFPTAVLRQQEVDITLRRQFINCLVHDPGETRQKQQI